MGSGVVAGGGLALRLAALLLVIAALGLPINELAAYALLVAAALLVLTGTPSAEPRRWLAAIALTAAVVAAHFIWPVPRIEEGHNVFLPGPSAAQSLPRRRAQGSRSAVRPAIPAGPALRRHRERLLASRPQRRGRRLRIFRRRHFPAQSILARGHRHRLHRPRASAPRRRQRAHLWLAGSFERHHAVRSRPPLARAVRPLPHHAAAVRRLSISCSFRRQPAVLAGHRAVGTRARIRRSQLRDDPVPRHRRR